MAERMLPLFPLEVVLLPEEPLPLHIFEDRYKLMIGECLQAKAAGVGEQQFGVVLAKDQEFRSVGCSARIVNLTRKYPDGRMDILTLGATRFEILFTDAEKPYLRGAVDYFEDDSGKDTADEEAAQRAIELFRTAMQRLHRTPEIPIHFQRPYRHLSFRMAAPLPLNLNFKQELLSLRNESERLHQVTRVTETLIHQLERLQKVQATAGGNGDIEAQQS